MDLEKELEDLKQLVYDILYNLPDETYHEIMHTRSIRERWEQR